MKLIFATHNSNKIKEILPLVGVNKLSSLDDLGFHDEIEETGKTLEENALIKARFIYDKFNENCFADDTGLEVECLDGAPGVYSARYAGNQKNAEDNMEKLLDLLKNKTNRKAQFRTVIALIIDGKEHLFEGIVKGEILVKKRGEKGFGYDPVFLPDGNNQSFAELPLNEKNEISHRASALKKLNKFLINK
jgi:XTP/dITP diphosphohydrolase